VRECLESAAASPPENFQDHKGWVLVALQNAFWQLLHAPSLEVGVCDTVMRGGDTDTNAAIAGALLGAVHGVRAIPAQWREAIFCCRPQQGRLGVHRPRPKPFWPIDAMPLARCLAEKGALLKSSEGPR
jgi:ADP-ribosyl-[dinitrogen reductase] hydrolase